MRCTVFAVVLFLSEYCAPNGEARTWYVLPDSTGDAPHIQAAIDSTGPGDTVLVASGTYYVNLEIIQKTGMSLIGEGGASATILDGDPAYNPSRRQVIKITQSPNTLVEGFTIQKGRPSPVVRPEGGGIFISGSVVTIRDNIIQNNRNDYGAAIGFVTNCTGCGGSIIRDNTILNNTSNELCAGIFSVSSSGSRDEFRIYRKEVTLPSSGLIRITNNYFEGNEGERACISTENTQVIVDSNVVINNTSSHYSISVWGGNGEVSHNLVMGNNGRGVVAGYGAVMNNTLVNNSGLGINSSFGSAYNNLSVGNQKGIGCYESEISCNNAWDNSEYDYGSPTGCDSVGINGNISADPLFCGPASGDYSIASESPCAAANSGGCGLIGAFDVGCTATSVPTARVEKSSWGEIKKIFR